MKKNKFGIILCLAILFSATFMGCRKWNETGTGSVRTVFNEGGQTLGYDTASGVKILTNKGFAFKDLKKEDLPFDMECHADSEGNSYDFGFGLNWSGVIKDSRVQKYSK